MKKKKILVIGIKTMGELDKPISIIVQSTSEEEAIQLVIKDIETDPGIYSWYAEELSKVKRLTPKDIEIKEIMKTRFSKEQLSKTIKMYENMLLLKGVNLKTIGEIFAPYLIMYDPVLEECIVSKTITKEGLIDSCSIMDIGFRFIPKKFQLFDSGHYNFKLWCQKDDYFNKNSFSLVVKQSDKKSQIKEWAFVDFVLELTKVIPDVPIRLEKVVIENL
jgi:hypothetical protein